MNVCLEMGQNYNKSKKEEQDVKHCRLKKVKYIKNALRYFEFVNKALIYIKVSKHDILLSYFMLYTIKKDGEKE